MRARNHAVKHIKDACSKHKNAAEKQVRCENSRSEKTCKKPGDGNRVGMEGNSPREFFERLIENVTEFFADQVAIFLSSPG